MTTTRQPPDSSPLTAKTAPPQRLRPGVDRRRLFGLLDAGIQRPVTLVCAGAGWGKTMLVSAWARSRPDRVAWLSLDRHDNDPQLFWGYLLAALRTAGTVPAGHPFAGRVSMPAEESARRHLLSDGFARLPGLSVLVIDDFHEITDVRILEEMNDLLRRSPTPLRVVLISRMLPAPAMRCLRSDGQVTEIRAEDLAFTVDEAKAMVDGHGLALAPGEVGELLDRTEGWAAGLHLGAGFLAGQDGGRSVADFAGDVRGVDGYLTNEVLSDLPADERRFLLRTSICEHLCADLANAITGDSDGQVRLEQLEQDNDFVVRLGAKPLWFRYHHLLRDALAHRLALEDPTAVADLHRRAARWYFANNSVLEALHHAVTARDWAYVGTIVTTRGAPLILSPQQSALVNVLRQVPSEEASSTPELIFCTVVLLFHAGDYEAIPERIARARQMLRHHDETTRRRIEAMLHTPEMLAERAIGDMPAVIRVSTSLLDLLVTGAAGDGVVATGQRAIALNHRGLALLWTGRPEPAARDLWASTSAARTGGVELTEINASGHLALLQILSGSVEEAAQLAAGARDLAEQRGWRYTLQAVAAHFAYALVALERHEPDAAEEALRHGLRAHHVNPEAAQRIVSRAIEARLALARGEPGRARLFVDDARRDRGRHLNAPTLDRWLSLVEAEVHLATGAPEPVGLRDDPPPPDAMLDHAYRVVRARFAYAARDLRGAEEMLDFGPTTLSPTVATVEAGILGALVADAGGHGTRAVDRLGAAVVLAAREGIRRPFVTLAGNRLDGLLQRLQMLTGAIPFLDGLASGAGRPAGPSSNGSAAVQDLSERETEVLRYLPTMLTAAEIASGLGVSVNTVKAHMRAIYRKLGAARRSEAVAQARQSGIL